MSTQRCLFLVIVAGLLAWLAVMAVNNGDTAVAVVFAGVLVAIALADRRGS